MSLVSSAMPLVIRPHYLNGPLPPRETLQQMPARTLEVIPTPEEVASYAIALLPSSGVAQLLPDGPRRLRMLSSRTSALFLASDESSFMTGSIVSADGEMTGQ
ncbi:MAG: hypothetical protein O2943_00375 [Actinomycetota bacterium]|nr:hypothetical protein [Actinomycetota bacterium]